MQACRVLIILGASGTVGRYLFDQAVASDRECRGTYFSRAAPDLECFDMSNLEPHILGQLCEGVSHGIITAGTNNNQLASREKWSETVFLNVD